MEAPASYRDLETIERDKIALLTVTRGLHRIRSIIGHDVGRWRRPTDAEQEIFDLADLLQHAPRLIAERLEGEPPPRSDWLIDDRTELAADLIDEKRTYDRFSAYPVRRPIWHHPIARTLREALLAIAAMATGYLFCPIINSHDNFTGIAATYPNDTVTCSPPQMVASIPNLDAHAALPVMFPCPQGQIARNVPTLPRPPQIKGR